MKGFAAYALSKFHQTIFPIYIFWTCARAVFCFLLLRSSFSSPCLFVAVLGGVFVIWCSLSGLSSLSLLLYVPARDNARAPLVSIKRSEQFNSVARSGLFDLSSVGNVECHPCGGCPHRVPRQPAIAMMTATRISRQPRRCRVGNRFGSRFRSRIRW